MMQSKNENLSSAGFMKPVTNKANANTTLMINTPGAMAAQAWLPVMR